MPLVLNIFYFTSIYEEKRPQYMRRNTSIYEYTIRLLKPLHETSPLLYGLVWLSSWLNNWKKCWLLVGSLLRIGRRKNPMDFLNKIWPSKLYDPVLYILCFMICDLSQYYRGRRINLSPSHNILKERQQIFVSGKCCETYFMEVSSWNKFKAFSGQVN